MKEIPLTQGKVALVDDADYESLMQHKWYAQKSNRGTWYAHRTIWGTPKKTTVPMHREIMQPADGLVIDHINHDGLDNRRENLRACESWQNTTYQRPWEGKKIPYRGVAAEYNKFSAHIQYRGHRTHLYGFNTQEEAARAYDKMASEFFGEFAVLNFPKVAVRA